MKISRKIIICIMLSVCFVLWWRAAFYDQKLLYSETDIFQNNEQFTAEFDTITGITISNDDISIAKRLSDQKCRLIVTISDTEGNIIAECKSDGIQINTNSYSRMQDCTLSNLPVNVKAGEQYNISYDCHMKDGTAVDNLSLILYSYAQSSNSDTLALFVILILITIIAVIGIGAPKLQISRYFAIWLLTVTLTLFIMPTLNSERERSAFADTYAMSNSFIGEKEADENGYTYISENGIRNGSDISNSMMLLRFWKDNSDGYARDEWQVSKDYKCDAKQNILMLPATFAVTIVRLLGKSDRLVMCAGWAANLLVSAFILFFCQMLLKETHAANMLLRVIFLMPSVIIELMSYTGFGIVISICALIFALFVCIMSRKRKKIYIVPTIVAIAIIAIYVLQNLLAISLSSNSIIEIICTGINTFFIRFDGLLSEFVIHDSLPECGIFITTYLFIIMIIVLKYQSDRTISVENAKVLTVKLNQYVGITLAYFFVVTLTGKCMPSTGRYGVFSNLSGVYFIPLLFIPCRINRNDKCSEDTAKRYAYYSDIMISIAAITSCIVELIRYEAL